MGVGLEHPFYDPARSYEENFKDGPYGAFLEPPTPQPSGEPQHTFLGHSVYEPFGIPAGPLLNGRFVKAALDAGFDLPVYKTVRTRKYASHPWPNVLGVKVEGDLSIDQPSLVGTDDYSQPVSITNSFGVPSQDPDVWQPDLAECVRYARKGQMVLGSYQGTKSETGSVDAYIADFVLGARLLKETGVQAIEVNLSCPNEGTAALLCFDVQRVARIVDAIKSEIGARPLVIKLAYFRDQDVLEQLLRAVGNSIDGTSSINTISTEIVDADGRQALPGEGRLRSGVCGHAIKWAGLEMTRRLVALREKLSQKFAIIGVGGVGSAADYTEYRAAGADAVMSATGAMWNPHLAREVKAHLYDEVTA